MAFLSFHIIVKLLSFFFLLELLGTGSASLQLLQWNPHWQCTAWNASGYRENAAMKLKDMLEESDIDFANIIEFEVGSQLLPANWTDINASCGWDTTTLVYNKQRWRPASSVGAGASGCMGSGSGPFIVQQFDRICDAGSGIPSGGDGLESLLVIGAHFPSPRVSSESWAAEQTGGLREALQAIVNATRVDKVVLIADTNAGSSTSNSDIGSSVGLPGGSFVGTSMEPTCCFHSGFPENSTFDRIIANFGGAMDTAVLMGDPVPAWAEVIQPGTGVKGGFHKPLHGVLLFGDGDSERARSGEPEVTGATPAAPATSTTEPHETVGERPQGGRGGNLDMLGDIFLVLVLLFVTSIVLFLCWRIVLHSRRGSRLMAQGETNPTKVDVESGAAETTEVDGK